MITSYSTLQSEVADWLNRTDLTSAIKTMIQMAEMKFLRDIRIRKLQNAGTFSITGDDIALPSDFMAMESWYHDGPAYYGEIEIVPASMLSRIKARSGSTGAPSHAAIIDGTVRFGPAPDQTYSTKMTYWRKLVALSGTNTTNWLLDEHPDVYLYGTLVESAPYLKDDARYPLWLSELESRMNAVHMATLNEQFSGSLSREIDAIGG